MESTINHPTSKKWIELIETVSKSSISFAAICYILGLVVVSGHLNKYGVTYIGVLRINYIMAGIWALVPILLALIYSFLLFCVLVSVSPPFARVVAKISNRDIAEYTKTNRFGVPAFFLLPSSLGVMVFVYGSFEIITGRKIFDLFVYNSRLIFLSAISFVIIPGILLFFSTNNRYKSKNNVFRNVFICVWAITHLIVYVDYFSYDVYGQIPGYIGGGKLKVVRLLLELKPKAKSYLENEGIQFDLNEASKNGDNTSETYMTKDVYLVFNTDNEYYVLVDNKASPKNSNVINLKKDIVKAVVHEFPRGGGF